MHMLYAVCNSTDMLSQSVAFLFLTANT